MSNDWSAMLDDAVHEINKRWGEPWGDDLLPMDQALVRETAEAVLLPVAAERDRYRDIMREWLEADVAAEIDFNPATEARLDAAVRAAQEAVRGTADALTPKQQDVQRRECDSCGWHDQAPSDHGGVLRHGEGTGCTATPVQRVYVALSPDHDKRIIAALARGVRKAGALKGRDDRFPDA